MNNISSPRTDDAGIEQEIKAKGLTGLRVTSADIEANITHSYYFTAKQGQLGFEREDLLGGLEADPTNPEHWAGNLLHESLGLLTFCVLVLRNGYTVTGASACASPENFDAELGRKIARANAVNKVWPLMGYSLKENLHKGTYATT